MCVWRSGVCVFVLVLNMSFNMTLSLTLLSVVCFSLQRQLVLTICSLPFDGS